ncbi:MAG TPA: ATP-grasp domain-containing protein [Actinomycetaceae bacterium]|nr:ATP-grasp domain-containing protein [Actinomycetaceae bacterium]
MTAHVFVLGLDAQNLEVLRSVPEYLDVEFHPLLTRHELQHTDATVPELVDRAARVLDAFPHPISAIVGYWDYPVSTMLPILGARYGVRTADLAAVVKSEHKYWSRLLQRSAIDEVPGFGTVDLHDPAATLPAHMAYPAWVKPIKSASSEGAYFIRNDGELRAALAKERSATRRMHWGFHDVLDMVELPSEIADLGPGTCLVEEALTGRQATVEGFSVEGRTEIFGVVDSIRYPHVPSFLRYEYPSSLPAEVQERMAELSRRVVAAVGLDHGAFNIEFFWDERTKRLAVLEINARHSQSHARLFHLVDGRSNHGVMLDLALGRTPFMPHREGEFPVAALWMLRSFSDGRPRRLPTPLEVAALEAEIPGTTIEIAAREGRWLSENHRGDSYSYLLANIVVAGQTPGEVEANFVAVRDGLIFDIEQPTRTIEAPIATPKVLVTPSDGLRPPLEELSAS